MTLLEAASYGCSIVASDIPPHLEVIGASGPGARVFPAGDVHQLTKAITEALQAPPDEERAGAEAPVGLVRRTYSWDTAAETDGSTARCRAAGPCSLGASAGCSMTPAPASGGGADYRPRGTARHRIRPQRDDARQHHPGLDAGRVRGR